MDCDKAIYRVYGYLDGELTVWRRWTIRRHLDKCPPCAQGFDFEVELREMRAQVVSLRTAVVGRRRPIAIGVESGFAGRAQDSPMSGPGGKPAAERRVWFDGDWHGTAIFRREHLPPGAVVQGPAIVEQMDTTTVIEPRDRAHVDAHGNLEIAVRALRG